MPSFLYRFQHLVSAQSLIWILEGSSVSTLQGPGGAHGSVEQSQNFENSGWPEWGLHCEGILAGCRRASASCDEQNRPKPLALSSWCSMCLMPVWHDTQCTLFQSPCNLLKDKRILTNRSWGGQGKALWIQTELHNSRWNGELSERKAIQRIGAEMCQVDADLIEFQMILDDSRSILGIFVCRQALAEGLKHNSTLTNLDLGGNKIGHSGAQAWCLGEDGEDVEESIMKEGGTAVGIQTELMDSEMVKWVKGRICRGLVRRCAKSIMQIWVKFELVLFISLQTTWSVTIRGSMRACGRRRWDFLYVNFKAFYLDDITTYFADLCLLSGIGRRTEAQLGPWQTWICFSISLALKGLRLGVWWGCEEPVMRGRGTAVGIQTELIEGGMVNWVKERPYRSYRGLVLRCAKSIQVHHAESEFELVLFLSLQTTWYVSIRGSMRRMR